MPLARIVAAMLVGAVVSLGCPARASDDWDAEIARYLAFNGVDLWRAGFFLHGGFVWSPYGVQNEGLAVKVLTGAGRYRYKSGTATIIGEQRLTAAMAGWRFQQPHFEASVFAGLDMQSHRFRPDDDENKMRGEHLGLRLAAELWLNLSPETMVRAWATWSSVDTSYALYGAFGLRLFGLFYLGPEAQASGDGRYRQVRFGLHATALRLGAWEWSAGLGFVGTASDDSGLYTRLGLLTRY